MKDNTAFEIRQGDTYHNNDGTNHEALGPGFEDKSIRVSRLCYHVLSVPRGQAVPRPAELRCHRIG